MHIHILQTKTNTTFDIPMEKKSHFKIPGKAGVCNNAKPEGKILNPMGNSLSEYTHFLIRDCTF